MDDMTSRLASKSIVSDLKELSKQLRRGYRQVQALFSRLNRPLVEEEEQPETPVMAC